MAMEVRQRFQEVIESSVQVTVPMGLTKLVVTNEASKGLKALPTITVIAQPGIGHVVPMGIAHTPNSQAGVIIEAPS